MFRSYRRCTLTCTPSQLFNGNKASYAIHVISFTCRSFYNQNETSSSTVTPSLSAASQLAGWRENNNYNQTNHGLKKFTSLKEEVKHNPQQHISSCHADKNDNNNYSNHASNFSSSSSSSGWPINTSYSQLTVQKNGSNNINNNSINTNINNNNNNLTNESSFTRTFWAHPVQPVNLTDVKRNHLIERTLDKQSRFTVRNTLRQDGVVSNLFPIYFPERNAHAAAEECPLYVYEMYATRQVRAKVTTVVHQNTQGDLKMIPMLPSSSSTFNTSSNNNNKRNEVSGSQKSRKNNNGNNNNKKSALSLTDTNTHNLNTLSFHQQRVNAGPTWRAVRRCLLKHFIKLPPIIQLEYKLYTNKPLPTEVLTIPPEFHDLGWLGCELRLLGRFTFADLKPDELQQVVNKIVPWVAREYYNICKSAEWAAAINNNNNSNNNNNIININNNNKTGLIHSFAVVRDRIGKLVSTSEGITAEGLRLFRGALVQALFVDESAAANMEKVSFNELPRKNYYNGTNNNRDEDALRPQTRHLAELKPGMSDPSAPPIHFYVDRYIRSLNFKGQDVDSYEISDASGKYFASYWSPVNSPALREGHVYAASNVHLRVFEKPVRKLLVEFTQGKSTVTELIHQSTVTIEEHGSNNDNNDLTGKTTGNIELTNFPGRLALKIDSKGTIGADSSLWEEIRNYFGPGPYDEETQRRINLSVSGTPVVISYSLRQSIVRLVRFGVQLLGPVHTPRPFDFTSTEHTFLEKELNSNHNHKPEPFTTTTNTNIINKPESLSLSSSSTSKKNFINSMQEQQRQEQESKRSSTALISQQQQEEEEYNNNIKNNAALIADRTLRAFHRNMDAELLAILPYLDRDQPYAVLADYTVLPLQVLHCCYDPRMRSWQDLGIAHLSLMPQQRMALLMQFREMLARGLQIWGLRLGNEPWRSKKLSLLPLPMKTSSMNYQQYLQSSPSSSSLYNKNNKINNHNATRHPMPQAHPSTMIIIGIYGLNNENEEAKNNVSVTVQRFGRYFNTSYVTCVTEETEAVKFMSHVALTSPPSSTSELQNTGLNNNNNNKNNNNNNNNRMALERQRKLKDPNTALIIVTRHRDSRATRWVMAECLSRGIIPVAVPPCATHNKLNLLCGNVSRQLLTKFESNPLRGVDVYQELPAIAQRRLLVIGVDSCHTNEMSTGSMVGLLLTPWRNHLLSRFWKHDARGNEVQHTSDHFKTLLTEAAALYDGLEEVVIFQDGDVYSELNAMHEEVKRAIPQCGLTLMCLHKRCNVRFVHDGNPNAMMNENLNNYNNSNNNNRRASPSQALRYHNIVKGAVIPALTPVPLTYDLAAPSFYMQTHESQLSTARIVQYTVHHTSPTMEITDVQQLANIMANVLSTQATKLPIPTRCAHKLADKAERLLDAVPQLTCDLLPDPLRQRLWYL